ncbi:hypothetical protein H2509_13390 [Stappia sp. F7233]|uniref:Uncharacterized protein n=1 Tax=Stappia albiluteola TaxID=2758565 RepID=A0A839AE85_9HYPH|nr:hypothetical protein [Stappia albiluteola]MBA5777446.1 hypothetical protein [Stappia albiluteola]MBA5777484.1 hypothetical protein [Stappia albiluteola]MBA5778105.1 hypothetical protein [Stappia albiluteola]MBA5778118.1 hypothetical protein [Stappia albiluteola]
MRPWSYDDIARAVGFRTLGEKDWWIAERLGRKIHDVSRTIDKALVLEATEDLPPSPAPPSPASPPATPSPAPVTASPRRHQETVRPRVVFRKYRVSPHLDLILAAEAGQRNSGMLGDPGPGRSALDQRKSGEAR